MNKGQPSAKKFTRKKTKEPHIAALSFGASGDYSLQLVSVQSANPNLLVQRILMRKFHTVKEIVIESRTHTGEMTCYIKCAIA
jgi:hypothetical protein